MKYYEYKRTYIAMRPPMQMMHYEPIGLSEPAKIGILLIHSNSDYLNQPAAAEFAKRGFEVMCANIPKPAKALDLKLLDVKRAFEYFKKNTKVEKILLFGHSGGATLMSAYQAVAENGCKVFQGDEKIYKIPEMEKLPKADGCLFIDSNWGNGAMTLLSLDAAILDENSGIKRDPELDPYSEKNGYRKDGTTKYSEAFIKTYLTAQRERMDRLVKKAQDRVTLINAGKGFYVDDEPFPIAGGEQIAWCNKLFPQDISLLAHTKESWTLLYGDQSRKLQVVNSLRTPMPAEDKTDHYNEATLVVSVKAFLSSAAVLANENYFIDDSGIYGIDYDSSFCCTPGNVHHIHVPTLVMGLNAGYEFMAAEEVYRNCVSEDKTLAFVNGVNHPIMVAHYLEKEPNEFGDPIMNMFDYIAEWIAARY